MPNRLFFSVAPAKAGVQRPKALPEAGMRRNDDSGRWSDLFCTSPEIGKIPRVLAGFTLLVFAPAAQAACSGPAGNAGDTIYNSAYHVYQYCDGATWIAMGPRGSGGSGLATGHNTVFVVADAYLGNFGSVAAANAVCSAAATAAGLSGTFLAWVAVTTGIDDPATTFTHSTIPYEEVDGTVIASNWTQLISGALTHGADMTASGTVVGAAPWTNVATNGTAATSGSSSTENCTAWTSNHSSKSGNYGFAGNTDATWTYNAGPATCNQTLGFYCFQQDATAASCSSPTANEGDMIYNSAHHMYQFCGGTSWQPMGPIGASGSGCSNPTGSEADIIFNSAYNVMQYCNSSTWVAFGK